MQLEELREIKRCYERKLRMLLRDFEAETSVQISDIHIEYMEIKTLNKAKPEYVLGNVDIDCRI